MVAAYIEAKRCLPPGRWWVERDKLYTVPRNDPLGSFPDKVVFGDLGLIRLDVGEGSTRITYGVDSALDGSIKTVLDCIAELPAPIELAFFKQAWAFERYRTQSEAELRLVEILATAGTPLDRISAVQAGDAECLEQMTPLVRRAITGETGLTEQQSLYRYDSTTDDFLAEAIGKHTSIAAVMGSAWCETAIGTTAAPSDDADEFDRPVVDRYHHVFETGAPAVDTVSAISTPPNCAPLFFTWQRLLQPWELDGRRVGCRVTTEHTSQAMPQLIVPNR